MTLPRLYPRKRKTPEPVDNGETPSMSEADGALGAAPASRRPRPWHIDELIALATQGLTDSEIARRAGCSGQNISKRLKPYRAHIEANRDYAATRGFRFTTVERRALDKANNLLDDETVTLSSVVSALDVVHRAGRLERGQSTVNLSSITAIAERLERGALDVTPEPLDTLSTPGTMDGAPSSEDVD